MTSSQKDLLSILTFQLFGKSKSFADIDWNGVYQESKVQAVSLYAYEVAKKECHLDDLMQRWNKTSLGITAENIRVFHNHSLITQWMYEVDIPCVILKGCASAYYYNQPFLRCMGDVDFIVPEEFIEKADTVLISKGFNKLKRKHISHLVYFGDNAHYELHFDIPGIPDGENGEVVRSYFSDIFEKSNRIQNEGSPCSIPSKFHHGLILLLHTVHHLTGEGIGLRHLCDWAVFENTISNDDFIDLFEKPLKRIGLWKFAKILTSICIKYLGADKKDWAMDVDVLIVDSLMEDILNSGNFGRKDINRKKETYLISSRGRNGVGKGSRVKQLIISVNEIVYVQHPLIKKFKILLPIGWFIFSINHLIRIITRKTHVSNINYVYKDAKRRRDIYSHLGIFETSDF